MPHDFKSPCSPHSTDGEAKDQEVKWLRVACTNKWGMGPTPGRHVQEMCSSQILEWVRMSRYRTRGGIKRKTLFFQHKNIENAVSNYLSINSWLHMWGKWNPDRYEVLDVTTYEISRCGKMNSGSLMIPTFQSLTLWTLTMKTEWAHRHG